MYFPEKAHYNFEDLCHLMTLLRRSDGCPWDRAQDHHSIRINFIEETYEVAEAIDNEDTELLKEELGDVLLQVVFHAEIEREKGNFTIDDVADGICRKMLVRHPFLFGSETYNGEEDAYKKWDAVKRKTKGQKSDLEAAKSVAKSLPALMRTEKVLSRMKSETILKTSEEEVKQTIKETLQEQAENREAMIGKLLLETVMLSKFYDINPESALTGEVNNLIEKYESENDDK